MNKILLDIHLYLGLVFTPYFVIYGLSTLAMNHGWQSDAATAVTRTQLSLPEAQDDRALAKASRDMLGVWGHVSQWQVRRIEDGRLEFLITRPGRYYHTLLDTETGQATVTEEYLGFWMVIKELHGYRGYKGSFWAGSWRVYSEASIWALIFASLAGVYIWWARAAKRRVGWWVLGVGTSSSALMMLYLLI